MSQALTPRLALRLRCQTTWPTCLAIESPCRNLYARIHINLQSYKSTHTPSSAFHATPRLHAGRAILRNFHKSPPLLKKTPKAQKNTTTDFSPPATTSPTPKDEIYDMAELEAAILRAIERLTHDLAQLRSGGRVNPEVVEGLKVQLGSVREGRETVKIGEVAQVVPRGRVLNVICGDESHIKPITSAIASSPHSLTPLAPTQENPLTILVPLPPPTGDSRRDALDAAKRAAEKGEASVQRARSEHNKLIRKYELSREVRPDDVQKAKKRMEEVVKKGSEEVKRISDGARRVLESQ